MKGFEFCLLRSTLSVHGASAGGPGRRMRPAPAFAALDGTAGGSPAPHRALQQVGQTEIPSHTYRGERDTLSLPGASCRDPRRRETVVRASSEGRPDKMVDLIPSAILHRWEDHRLQASSLECVARLPFARPVSFARPSRCLQRAAKVRARATARSAAVDSAKIT